jgi:hypothetical protein
MRSSLRATAMRLNRGAYTGLSDSISDRSNRRSDVNNDMKAFASPKPKPASKSMMVALLERLQQSAHPPHVSLESLQYAVDYYVFSCLDFEGSRRFDIAETARYDREKLARAAAAEASRAALTRVIGRLRDKTDPLDA